MTERIDWISFFRTLTVASGTAARPQQGTTALRYNAVMMLSDAGTNDLANHFNMLPLPGGRGDLGMSELAERHRKESAP